MVVTVAAADDAVPADSAPLPPPSDPPLPDFIPGEFRVSADRRELYKNGRDGFLFFKPALHATFFCRKRP